MIWDFDQFQLAVVLAARPAAQEPSADQVLASVRRLAQLLEYLEDLVETNENGLEVGVDKARVSF